MSRINVREDGSFFFFFLWLEVSVKRIHLKVLYHKDRAK